MVHSSKFSWGASPQDPTDAGGAAARPDTPANVEKQFGASAASAPKLPAVLLFVANCYLRNAVTFEEFFDGVTLLMRGRRRHRHLRRRRLCRRHRCRHSGT